MAETIAVGIDRAVGGRARVIDDLVVLDRVGRGVDAGVCRAGWHAAARWRLAGILGTERAAPAAVRVGGAERRLDRAEPIPAGRAYAACRLARIIGRAIAVHIDRAKIGRASCRDKVCPYV